jgi:hypothetical protein
MWSGWDGVGTAAVTLVGSIAYFTRDSSTIPKLSAIPVHNQPVIHPRVQDRANRSLRGMDFQSRPTYPEIISPERRQCGPPHVHPREVVQFPSLLFQ